MRSIVITIVCGLAISAAFLGLVYVWALVGYPPALQLLLKLTMPPFNIAAMLAESVPPDDLERGGQMIDFMLLVAWLQIGALAALLVAGIAALARRK